MRFKFKWIFTLLLALVMQSSFAQQKTVTGTVTDDQGLTLPGATVTVRETKQVAVSDIDGKYSIQASQGQTLEFSFAGMQSSTQVVGASSVVNVKLSSTMLEEVVVVGYGTTTKEGYTGTAAKINTENVRAKTFSNVTQALKGEVAGVNVITTSGQPGTDAVIRIRGFGSINGNRAPLYVLDGVPYNGDLSAINSNDIESMTILKDATATAVYGSRGANGVILINTKSGKLNTATSVTVDLKTSINARVLPTYDVITSPEEFIEIAWSSVYGQAYAAGSENPAAYANSNLFGDRGISAGYNMWNATAAELIDRNTGKVNPGVTRRYDPENWSDYAFQTSYRQEANVQFSGGSDKTTYASSFGYLDDQGYIVNSNFRRYSTRLALTHAPKSWLKMGSNIGYTGSRYTTNGQSSDSGSIFWFTDNMPAIFPLFLRDEFGNKVEDPYFGGYQYDYGDGTSGSRGFGGLTNSIADAHYDMNRTYQHDFNGTFTADVDLYDGLKFEFRYGVQYQDADINNRNNPFYGSSAGTFGSLTKTRYQLINQNALQLLRYTKKFGDHNIEAFAAHESTERNEKTFSASKQRAILYDTFDLDQYTTAVGKASSFTNIFTLESYFGQLSYNYDQKYYLTASVRRDGSSRFKYDKWGTFGSIGASWIVSKENFMSKASFVDFLKLKASYGVIGDQGARLMNGWVRYTIGTTDEYSFTLEDEKANANITWETSKVFQVGLESTFMKWLDVNLDYYVKQTDNLLFFRSLPPSTGYNRMLVNDGQLKNSGLEFDIQTRIIEAKQPGNFGLSFGVNGELLKNEITMLPIDPSSGERMAINEGYVKGHSIYEYYMPEWAGVDPATGVALWNSYYNDINDNGLLDAGDEIIRNLEDYKSKNEDINLQKTTTSDYSVATSKLTGKSSIPKVRGAFRISSEYSNFDLTAQFSYSVGGYVYDNTYAGLMHNDQVGSNNWHADIRNRWQKPGDITNVPRLTNGDETTFNNTSTRFLTKADYLGLNNLRIGYTLPDRFLSDMGISRLNIYASGDNLLFFSKRKGLNPSTSESGNSSTYRYLPLTTFTLGVRLDF